MKTAGNLLPLLAMITLTTACSKEELATPASITQDPTYMASRPDVNGFEVTDPTTSTGLMTNGLVSSEVPSAVTTGQQTSGTLNTNELSPRSPSLTTQPMANQFSVEAPRPDCSFPLEPGLLNNDAGSTKRGQRTPPIIPHLDY